MVKSRQIRNPRTISFYLVPCLTWSRIFWNLFNASKEGNSDKFAEREFWLFKKNFNFFLFFWLYLSKIEAYLFEVLFLKLCIFLNWRSIVTQSILRIGNTWPVTENAQGGKLHARRNAGFHSVNYQNRRVSFVMNICQKIRNCVH